MQCRGLGPAGLVREVMGGEERRGTSLGSIVGNVVKGAAVLVQAVGTEVDGERDSL